MEGSLGDEAVREGDSEETGDACGQSEEESDGSAVSLPFSKTTATWIGGTYESLASDIDPSKIMCYTLE